MRARDCRVMKRGARVDYGNLASLEAVAGTIKEPAVKLAFHRFDYLESKSEVSRALTFVIP